MAMVAKKFLFCYQPKLKSFLTETTYWETSGIIGPKLEEVIKGKGKTWSRIA